MVDTAMDLAILMEIFRVEYNKFLLCFCSVSFFIYSMVDFVI